MFLYNAFNKRVTKVGLTFSGFPSSLKFNTNQNIAVADRQGVLRNYDLHKQSVTFLSKLADHRLPTMDFYE